MGRSLLIQDRELESCGTFTGRIDIFFGSLKAKECPSKYGIRCGPLLGGACFGFSSLVFRLYAAPLLCSSAFPGLCSSCAKIGYY
jgi:hypothetical protein